MKTELESRILQICESILEPVGFRIVDVDCRIGHKSLVRVYIERTAGDATTKAACPTLDECASASRLLEPALDADEGLIAGAYDLEVSSPGLDRRLRLESDFVRAEGQPVKLKLTQSITGLGANVTGQLTRIGNGEVHVEVDRKEWAIPLGKIKQANTVWRFQ